MDSDQAAEARPEEPGATVDDGAPADPEAGADGEGPSDRTVVEEAEEILSMVDKMVQSQGEEAARLLPRWRAVVRPTAHTACLPRSAHALQALSVHAALNPARAKHPAPAQREQSIKTPAALLCVATLALRTLADRYNL